MSPLFLLGLLLFGILTFIVCIYSYESIEDMTVGNAKWVAGQLDLMFITTSPKMAFRVLMVGPFLIGLIFFTLCLPSIALGLICAMIGIVAGFKIPRPLIQAITSARIRKINAQLMEGLTLMANSLRSGLSLMQTLQIVAQEMPNPLAQEMNLILSEQRLGVPVEKSFQNFANRIPTEDIEMFVTSVVVLRETGGNLAETFDTIVYTIRERLKLTNKISAMMTQGKVQGMVVTAMPFVLMIVLHLLDPKHMEPLYTTIPGYAMLALMLGLLTVGALVIRKIVNIQI